MTLTETLPIEIAKPVTLDLYRDVHKGIRSGLFQMTELAGRTDSSDPVACAHLADVVAEMVLKLDQHAETEDAYVGPVLELHLPQLQEKVEVDHHAFEPQSGLLVEMARCAAEARGVEQRNLVHRLYMDSALFTSRYLAHQDMEERLIMPQLEDVIGLDACLDVHNEIIGSIPPDKMAKFLALMLPAMNIDDRTEMLAGIRMTAPAEVFEGVLGLAGSVLAPNDFDALVNRLA